MAKIKSTSGNFCVLEFVERSCRFAGCITVAAEHVDADFCVAITQEAIIHIIFCLIFGVFS